MRRSRRGGSRILHTYTIDILTFNRSITHVEDGDYTRIEQQYNLHPSSIITIVYSFSASVLGATLPKPTDIRPVKQK